MNVYDVIPQYAKMLHNLDGWLDKAAAHAQAKKFDVDTLVHARLAPDMYSLDRQIQSACDSAKFATAYLSGKTAPPHPDTEKTTAELRARIKSCLAFLETATAPTSPAPTSAASRPSFSRENGCAATSISCRWRYRTSIFT